MPRPEGRRLSSSPPLATRTEVAAPAGQADFLNPRSAEPTRLSLSPINPEIILESSFPAFPIPKIPDGSSAGGDGLLEDSLNRRPELFPFSGSQEQNVPGRMETGLEANLVSVDIANSCQELLVKEETLKPAPPAPEESAKGLEVKT